MNSRKREIVKALLRERDGNHCFYCGKPMARGTGHSVTIEHLLSQSHGGTNNLENLVLAGSRCNGRVSDRPLHEKLKMRDLWYSAKLPDYPNFFLRRGWWSLPPDEPSPVWVDEPGQPSAWEFDHSKTTLETKSAYTIVEPPPGVDEYALVEWTRTRSRFRRIQKKRMRRAFLQAQIVG